jgi:hypothetical protein
MGAEKRGILLFRFLTSNETEINQSKKLKIRPKIELTQVNFFLKSRFTSLSHSTEKAITRPRVTLRDSSRRERALGSLSEVN